MIDGGGGVGVQETRAGRLHRFLVVGGLSAAIDVGLLIVLREAFLVPVPLATTVAFWVALAVNFAANHRWAFRARGGVARSLPRYMALVAVTYLLTLAVVTGGVAVGVPYVAAKVVALGSVAIVTFLAYDRWVFA